MSVYKNDNPQYLIQAIDSMLNQTIKAEQFVIVEDGPVGEDIEEVIRHYEKDNKLFTIVRLEKNGGLGNALNQGFKVCRNELIARMDADDISKPERCEKQLKTFAKNPGLVILGTQIEEFIGTTDNVVSSRKVPTTYEEIKKFARRRSPFNHPTVMYKKNSILALGGYMTYGRKEDLDLFIRAVNNGCFSGNLRETLLYYRTSDDNLRRRKTWINCKEYIQIIWGFFRKGYCGISDVVYVIAGQIVMFLFPSQITVKMTKKFLRSE